MQKILGGMRKAISDYNMISPNDKVAVGVSGGKDSLLLLTALVRLRSFIDIPFDLLAIHIDMGFKDTDKGEFKAFEDYICNLGIELIVEKTNLAKLLFEDRKETNPCSLCSKIRRGALNTVAINNGCKKIALGHHSDDVLETFLLSFMYESRLSTFKPVSYLDRTDVTIIRPMVLINESLISGAIKNMPVVHNPCPANKHTQRQYMKELIAKLRADIPMSRERMIAALTHPERNNLW